MIQWRKSSRSQSDAQGNCVEISTNIPETTLIRDSKDSAGPHLSFARFEMALFISNAKNGIYDL